jgi:cobalt-zinc-cadmium efflux system outer membrane protein
MARDDAKRTLEFMVKSAFEQVVIAKDTVTFSTTVAESNAKTLALMQHRYRLGENSEADEARVATTKLESDQQVDLAKQTLETAKYSLAFLLGVRNEVPEFDVVAPELARFQVPAKLSSAQSGQLIEEAMNHRPDLRAARFQAMRAQSSVALAKRVRFPDVSFSINYAQQGNPSNPSTITPPTLSLGLGATLPIFYQQQGDIQKAEADLQTQVTTALKTEAQVVSDVETAFATYVASAQLVRRMETGGLLERSGKALELVTVQYQKGAASLLELLDAKRTYNSTHLEYLQDLSNYWTAVFRLEQAVGTELRS